MAMLDTYQGRIFNIARAERNHAPQLWQAMLEPGNQQLFRQIFGRSCASLHDLEEALDTPKTDSTNSSVYALIQKLDEKPTAWIYQQTFASTSTFVTALFAPTCGRSELSADLITTLGPHVFEVMQCAEWRCRAGAVNEESRDAHEAGSMSIIDIVGRRMHVEEDPKISELYVLTAGDWPMVKRVFGAWLETLLGPGRRRCTTSAQRCTRNSQGNGGSN